MHPAWQQTQHLCTIKTAPPLSQTLTDYATETVAGIVDDKLQWIYKDHNTESTQNQSQCTIPNRHSKIHLPKKKKKKGLLFQKPLCKLEKMTIPVEVQMSM